MIGLRAIIALSTLLASIAGLARAQDRLVGFQMPSKNIGCQFFAESGEATLRCDITFIETRQQRLAGCERDSSHAFAMTAKGSAGQICVGDTIIDPSLPVLAYGEVWQRAGFTCRSEQTGLTCFNAMQHGFSLARAERKVF
ncbi:hypothetical protein JQ621_31910 [Bradyrhizobium manausense]|uniref:DUF6636 domain-containing protein n=1 Tax=Bradyrhizobium manausense TaxID=989370 RepID=UPI001BA8EF3C|nr:DUF6636 domain-containing protein [Bradyrhizobium manausense]MBR1092078.1 hypothetical protein [Bradyrhizobium manausense]